MFRFFYILVPSHHWFYRKAHQVIFINKSVGKEKLKDKKTPYISGDERINYESEYKTGKLK